MNKIMKKCIASPFLLVALVSASCENPDYVPAEYNVRLNEANSYRVGEPVRFDITGNVDNLLFYSGETGHEYKYYNRYLVAPSDIRAARSTAWVAKMPKPTVPGFAKWWKVVWRVGRSAIIRTGPSGCGIRTNST